MKYLQCEIKKGRYKTFTWLPQKYAKVGIYIMLKEEFGKWSNGWKVINVYTAIEMDSETMEKRSQDYKHQREMSDV